MILKKKKIKLVAKLTTNKTTIARFHKLAYYQESTKDTKDSIKREEKRSLSEGLTKRISREREYLKAKFEQYKINLFEKSEGVFVVLKNIYDRSRKLAKKYEGDPSRLKPHEKFDDLHNLVASLPMLMLGYRCTRSNEGAMTKAWTPSNQLYSTLTPRQIQFLNRTYKAPDGLNVTIFNDAQLLLKQGLYPWGTSKRVWVEKPGRPDSERPITIPPFVDRIVQSSILKILEAIYEPWFDKLNVSFGFRANKGVHDCIYSLTKTNLANGLTTAIEGDIKAAYDNVNKEKLVKTLSQTIKDQKFLKLLRTRIDYQYFDTKTDTYHQDKDGIPQGGIDSPYLWNIYMHTFDMQLKKHLDNKFETLNNKARVNLKTGEPLAPKTNKYLTLYNRIDKEVAALTMVVSQLNKSHDIDKIKDYINTNKPRFNWVFLEYAFRNVLQDKYFMIARIARLRHIKRKLPTSYQNTKFLRFVYTRYADDWILMTNTPKNLTLQIKEDISQMLKKELDATLSVEKTLITNILKEPCHFLGFQLKSCDQRKLKMKPLVRIDGLTKKKKVKMVLSKVAGSSITSQPDKQRQIDRLYLKGYCSITGFPKEIGAISALEPHMIIERYNAVLRGMVNYYCEFIDQPRTTLNRWVYIVRFSCLKTFAQKYKTSIRGIFKKFGLSGKPNTIKTKVTIKVQGQELIKEWHLLTLPELITSAQSIGRLGKIQKAYNSTRLKGSYEYPQPKKGSKIPVYSDQNFLDKILWTNLRTQASFDIGCSICTSENDIEMHHIRSIRTLNKDKIRGNPLLETLRHRNRNQLPLCHDCHMILLSS